LVVVVGKTNARILLTASCEIKELTNIVKIPAEPDSGRDGSTGDMHKLRAVRQRQESYRLLHKDAINGLERIVAEETIKRILIGGTERSRAGFKGLISNNIREKIVSEFAIEHNAGDQDILSKIQPLMQEVEANFERQAVDDLFNQSSRYVLGLSDVLTALQQGNVHKMYVISNASTSGMICNNCHALTPDRDRPCPYCSSEMKPITHMLDLAIQNAYDQGSRVDMIDQEPRLEKAGGIGALLRY
jgi:peptide subunit release factor 1 (eRF1)